MPSTKTIGATLAGLAVPVLGALAAFGITHWDVGQHGAVVALWGVTVALIAALIAHFRPGSPSRWVAVLGLIGPEASALLGVLFVFHAITEVQVGAVMGIVAAVLGTSTVAVAQDKVTSPETREKELQAAAALIHPQDIAR